MLRPSPNHGILQVPNDYDDDLSVLSMSVMYFQKLGIGGGWSELFPGFFRDFLLTLQSL